MCGCEFLTGRALKHPKSGIDKPLSFVRMDADGYFLTISAFAITPPLARKFIPDRTNSQLNKMCVRKLESLPS